MIRLLMFYGRFTRKMNFGLWLVTEEYRQNIVDSVKEDVLKTYDLICTFTSKIVLLPVKWIFTRCYWEYSLALFLVAMSKSQVKLDIPISRGKATKSEEDKIPWDYKGRTKYYLVHILASEYGWTIKEIENMKIIQGLSLVQEILVGEQLEKEFTWSLSEIAYPYNKNTKKSEFKPLKRPSWMLGEIKKLKTFKIPKDLMPMGNVQDIGGMEEYVRKVTNENQETAT